MQNEFAILAGDAAQVAPRLLGCWLIRDLDGQQLIGRIVETEAYDQLDAASHSYRGLTPRNKAMFGPSGFLYVYFTYGMHYCANIVVGESGYGAAVLIRAVEPIQGLIHMRQRRGTMPDRQLTNGPAKLCYALSIDDHLNGHNLSQPPLRLVFNPPLPANQLTQTTRIGISQDTERPWRFYITDSPYVSKH